MVMVIFGGRVEVKKDPTAGSDRVRMPLRSPIGDSVES